MFLFRVRLRIRPGSNYHGWLSLQLLKGEEFSISKPTSKTRQLDRNEQVLLAIPRYSERQKT